MMAYKILSYRELYAPPDVETAITTYNANCGPAALAAILRQPLAAVPALMPEFRQRGYTNPSMMLAACTRANCRVSTLRQGPEQRWPSYGLGFIQWHGPWLAPGVPIGAAYRHTHWVGVAHTQEYGRMLYDINAWDSHDQRGDWVPLAWWGKEIAPAIRDTIPKASGGWSLRWACEVD